MQEEQLNIEDLILLYLKHELTAKQETELNAWLQQHENRQLFEELTNQDTLKEKLISYHTIETTQKEQGKNFLLDKEFPGARIIQHSHEKRRTAYWVAAAAIVLVTIGTWLLLNNYNKKQTEPVTAQQQSDTKEIAPGGNKAILTLSDNSKIVLDEAQNGSLAKQGNTAITKDEGILTYKAGKVNGSSSEALYNTISTPRGGQFHVVLPDGSHVWLNAASSIHFPAQFGRKERRVEVTGEVYAEVAKDATKPFRVVILSADQKEKQEVEVLGTHFNINAYDDEPSVNTTLLEGRIQVGNRQSAIGNEKPTILNPGQQSQLATNGNMEVVNNVDLDAVVAWKNGNFSFKDATIETIMRNAQRWYNVEVKYQGTIKQTFEGEIPRKVPLQSLLKILESTDRVHFKIEGRTITVVP